MEANLPPVLAGMLLKADVSQAAFARLTGVTARHVNSWCRGRAVTPRWALILAVMLQAQSPEALAMMLEEALLPSAQPASEANRPPDRRPASCPQAD